jgi:predicted dehydrogenase
MLAIVIRGLFLSAFALMAAGLGWCQANPIVGIAAAGFRVGNLEKSRAYYTGLLGYQQAFELKSDAGRTEVEFFKVSDEQYLELSPGMPPGAESSFTHLAFQTTDIEALRRALAARGLNPPGALRRRDGNLAFSLRDPENQRIEFIQYLEGSLQDKARGKFLDWRRISDHLQHVGVVVHKDHVEAALHFYRDQLGLAEFWRYSPGGELRLIKLICPGKRRDIVELMIYGKPPNRAEYGSMYHINFEVPEITPPYRKLLERGARFDQSLRPVVNAENIWAFNAFDPDGKRTEVQDLRKVPAIRLGVAGLVHGHAGGFFSRFSPRYDAQIVGIAEADAKVAAGYADRYKLDPSLFYTRLEDMLDKARPQAVVVFTNTYDHQAVVEACAARGIHVMMEKPLSVNAGQARAMEEAAGKGRIQVLVNYETTWHRSNGAAWSMAGEKGALGQIRKMVAHDGHRGPKEIGVQPEFLSWLTDPVRNGAGALFDFGCYGADLMTWLMGGERPTSVSAVTQQMKPDIYSRVDDEATIILTYPHAQGIIQASWNWPFDRKDLEIYGTTGLVRTVGPGSVRLRLEGKEEEEVEAPPLNPRYDDPVSYLTAVVRGEIQPSGPSSLAVNVIVMEILDAARRSASSGQTIRLAAGS